MSASEQAIGSRASVVSRTLSPGVGESASRWAGRLRQRWPWGWTWTAFALFGIGLAVSVLFASDRARSDADRARLTFRAVASQVASTLKLAIEHEQDLVLDTSAFVARDPDASPANFDRWVESAQAMSRYPELQDIGMVALVPAAKLRAFEARIAANPILPLGPDKPAPREQFEVLPAGHRPYYCFAVSGRERSLATYLPDGVDFCAAAPSLISSRVTGQSQYAPLWLGAKPMLGIETPVYRSGVIPKTAHARRREFLGWLGEILAPQVILVKALEAHAGMAVRFVYDANGSKVAFSSGRLPHRAQTATSDLDNGWTVESFASAPTSGILADRNARELLLGGVLMSMLVGALAFVLATGRRRALALVQQKTRELSHLALHDPLTKLPNRALVVDRAGQLLARTARDPSATAGALYIDIDGFKRVNDTLGHAAGDQLLKTFAERLCAAVRAQDTVGRLGGDEFVVLAESTADEATADILADRLTQALREPVKLGESGKRLSVTVSIGVATGDFDSADTLLHNADLALYAAKAAGKDRFVLFDSHMRVGARDRLQLETDLASAVENDELMLLYQPIFELPTRKVRAVEALIRWNHPTRGTLSPDRFMQAAEESGLIVPIGRFVLDRACAQTFAWVQRGLDVGLSVNVSAHQLGRGTFCDDVRHALADSGLEPSSLTVEITETALMSDVDATRNDLEAIRALGVRVAIDDFGTGYTSLAQLQTLPVDTLKIDRSFISALAAGGHSRKLLEAITGVGDALGATVIAEGVEEESQLTALEDMGCSMAQGFLLQRPAPADFLDGYLAELGAATSCWRRTAPRA